MRETIKEWKEEWIATYGETSDTEVLISDSNLDDSASYIYEGCFAKIPVELEEKEVIKWAKVCASTVPARIGAYSLTI